MFVEMSAQKIYSEQSLDYAVEIILFEVIVLHHSANPISHTQPREEEAVVFTPAKPQRGLGSFAFLPHALWKGGRKRSMCIVLDRLFYGGFSSDANG